MEMDSHIWMSSFGVVVVSMAEDLPRLAQVEVVVWCRGGVDGGGPAKVVTSICSEDGPVEDGGDDTCECVRPV